jgi:hypothetical protein
VIKMPIKSWSVELSSNWVAWLSGRA